MGVQDRRRAIQQTRKVEPPRTVSILITARNYGRFLPEAIESAINQRAPCEVIYSDDFSTDDSLAVAKRYESRGLIVLEAEKHLGVCEARNRAAAASTGEFLVHLDGDDILPEGFVCDHLRAMKPDTPFVYGPAQAFGTKNVLWRVPEWRDYDRWWRNTVNTSAMYRRSVFEAAGGWRDVAGSMWDWDLALRACRFGTPAASTATLQYRQHPESWSHSHERQSKERDDAFRQSIRKANIRLSVVAVLSGRVPKLFARWLDAIIESLQWVPQKPELVVLDNSRDEQFNRRVRYAITNAARYFTTTRVIRHDAEIRWNTERERRDGVATFMANACNRLTALSHGDLVWMVEDDVLVPPHAIARLMDVATTGDAPHAVTGLYRSRHGTGKIVAGHKRDGWKELADLPDEPMPVDFAGTGCLLFWRNRPQMPERFESHVENVPAHDWAWGMELKRKGGTLLAVPDVKCGHAATHREIVNV